MSRSVTHGRPSSPNGSCATTSLTNGQGTKHSWPSTATRKPLLVRGIAAEDVALVPVNAGQGVGSLTEVCPAAQVIERLCLDASSMLHRVAQAD